MPTPPGAWDAVAISTHHQADAVTFCALLQDRLAMSPDWGIQLGISASTMIFPVPDPFASEVPKQGDVAVGSGGATLNAFLHVAEHISAQKQSGTIETDVFKDWRIVVLLCGSAHCDASSSHLGKALAPLPVGPSPTLAYGGMSNVELMLVNLRRLADRSPAVWVCSTEWLLLAQDNTAQASQFSESGISVLAIRAEGEAAESHGVYKVSPEGKVLDVLYRPGADGAKKASATVDGEDVYVVAPLVRFCPKTAEALLSLHAQPPFDACTYYGSDSSSSPSRLNLYLDIILSATPEGGARYLTEHAAHGEAHTPVSTLSQRGRQLLLRSFANTTVKAVCCDRLTYYSYPRNPSEWHSTLLGLAKAVTGDPVLCGLSGSIADYTPTTNAVVFRSFVGKGAVIGEDAVVICSRVGAGCTIGPGSFVYHVELKEGTVVPPSAVVGVEGSGWRDEVAWTKQLCADLDIELVQRGLRDGSDVTTPLHRLAVGGVVGAGQVLGLLDRIARSVSLPETVRCLFATAEFLAALSRGRGGLRSGPARNPFWLPALDALSAWDMHLGEAGKAAWISALAAERERWMETPERLIRAARHYEGAAALITAKCVDTATRFVQCGRGSAPPLGVWVMASSPARIDLSGGWTDTPPISYESGGVVVNAAIRVGGEKPLKAYVRRTETLHLRFWSERGETVCTSLLSLRDYNQPQAPAALLKAALVALDVIDPFGPPLEEQLEALGGGLELCTASGLPVGSGLGGSSILGGVLLHSLGIAVGRDYGKDALVHAVLRLEQLLTSGGGWQDQVGGMYGGLKACRSDPSLPLKVTTEVLNTSPAFLDTLDKHLVLVYTGRARLARNLLQGVLRRWAARLPHVVRTVGELKATAGDMIQAIAHEDLEGMGRALLSYWGQKKEMAGGGVEPAVVSQALEEWKGLYYGANLGGAGGGGFLVLLTKHPNAVEDIKATFHADGHLTFFPVEIDREGITSQLTENNPIPGS
eukprot:Sspe_Gene.7068::Locus_2383_Transcript_1_1_Confidence_1.000_Length_3074::g.7068::m.7068/K05305/FUK; fucokinase